MPFFFTLIGFSALVMICRYLIKLISPPAKSEVRQANMLLQAEQKYHPLQRREPRKLNEPPYSQQSVIEETTQQFEDERRVR